MRALLLAAGKGTRLHPVTKSVPKCLVAIHGHALLDYWLDCLFADDLIERVLINTHYLARQVEGHVARSRWSSRIDLIHEAELLGTAGTIRANRTYFGADPFLVAHADNLTTFDIAGFVAAHAERPSNCVMSMMAFRTDDPRSCGILELDDSGVVVGFHEKTMDPPGNLANAALYVLTPELADSIARSGGVTDFSTQVIPAFIGRIFVVEGRGYHRDIGTLDSLRQANEDAIRLFG